MLTYAIVVFAIAAVGGVFMATKVFSGQLAPWPLSIVHALLGATGLIMLIMMVLEGGAAGAITAALGLLVVAALGGFYLASFHMKNVVAPKNIVIIHAGVAVVGFLTLLSVFLGI
ncbi:hypothetical protein SAMN05216302_10658 [Nitrosomonas aestuarii]|uniref:Uncharacterized protein n=1 Tax=Nitrosomonas aestuarii TaxID=52441 RepID=A0A1I4GZB6_9PROT|nr:hypothetical protein [Nitrosomonas aestuarii]SFL34707.1 hypothetical protein SAMN05216302_10658 [Nitrosomonas aestuarii]